MNVYTVGRATFGVADYLVENSAKSVCIAFDSRYMSFEFAKLAAEIMSFKGIIAYIFENIEPTPLLSYTIRRLKADAGIMITASHNPKEYNGYKVYNGKGCQITDDEAAQITEKIRKYTYFNDYIINESKIKIIGEEMLNSFLDSIENYSLPFERKYLPKIIYTPLNGTGNYPIKKIIFPNGSGKLFDST